MADNELNNLPPAEDTPPEEPEKPTEDPKAEDIPPGEPVDEPPDPTALKSEIEQLEEQKKKAAEAAKYWRQQKAQARADYFRDQRKPTEEKPKETDLKRPDPNDYDDYNDYVDALTDYKVEAKKQAWEREESERRANETYQEKQTRLQDKINEGYGKYEDFEEVAMDPAAPITPMIVEILAESEVPADVAYYLGKNRTEAIAISRMTPIAAAREIAKIETKLASGGTAPPPKKTTAAPPPIKPVGSGPSAVSKDPNKMSQKEYEAWRAQQGARRF